MSDEFPEVSVVRDVARSAKKGMRGLVIGKADNLDECGNVVHAVMIDETGRVVAIPECDLVFTGNMRSRDDVY